MDNDEINAKIDQYTNKDNKSSTKTLTRTFVEAHLQDEVQHNGDNFLPAAAKLFHLITCKTEIVVFSRS